LGYTKPSQQSLNSGMTSSGSPSGTNSGTNLSGSLSRQTSGNRPGKLGGNLVRKAKGRFKDLISKPDGEGDGVQVGGEEDRYFNFLNFSGEREILFPDFIFLVVPEIIFLEVSRVHHRCPCILFYVTVFFLLLVLNFFFLVSRYLIHCPVFFSRGAFLFTFGTLVA
jgi:hypothetical protein